MTDAISAESLRKAWEPEACAARPKRENESFSVSDGDAPVELRCTVDGSDNPELVPLWRALVSFSTLISAPQSGPNSRIRIKRELESTAMSDFSIDEVLKRGMYLSNEARIAAAGPITAAREELKPLLDVAKEVLPPNVYRTAIREKRADLIATASSEDEEYIAKLLHEASEDPWQAPAVALLPRLKESLGEEDWRIFRRYLFEEVAPRMSIVEFYDA